MAVFAGVVPLVPVSIVPVEVTLYQASCDQAGPVSSGSAECFAFLQPVDFSTETPGNVLDLTKSKVISHQVLLYFLETASCGPA